MSLGPSQSIRTRFFSQAGQGTTRTTRSTSVNIAAKNARLATCPKAIEWRRRRDLRNSMISHEVRAAELNYHTPRVTSFSDIIMIIIKVVKSQFHPFCLCFILFVFYLFYQPLTSWLVIWFTENAVIARRKCALQAPCSEVRSFGRQSERGQGAERCRSGCENEPNVG